ncbi:MAG: hypothetical protein ABSB19_11785 [Methylomonas sp.]|jgi:hypothetical protein
MALTSANLNDIGFGPGKTENFLIQYDDSLPDQTDVIANANALMAIVENEFTVTTAWFNTPSGKFGTANRQVVNLDRAAGSGANNSGYGSAISVDSIGAGSNPQESVKMVWMNEWAEILMSIAGNWNAGDSSGEGLSQYCGIVRFQVGHYSYYDSWVDGWLNGVTGSPNAERSDWVTQTFHGSGSVHGDGDSVSFGCALAFIYYLNVQLDFSINQIIAAYANNLGTAYQTLTGDSGNPFPFFLNLVSNVYPASATADIPGPVSDNPFPMAIVSFADNKNTYGLDEAKDIINQGGLVSGAFWVLVDGFNKQSFNAHNITATNNFTGDFFTLPGVQITPNPIGPQFQAGINNTTPQRIGIPFDITLDNDFLTQNPGTYTLTVTLTSNGNPVSGGTVSTQFELLAGADPYFSNIDINQDNQPYLSQDLRVFTITPAQNATPIPGGPSLVDSVAGAYNYIQQLLIYLNSTPSFTNPRGVDPFTTVFPDQYGANQTDSSVSPFTLDTSAFPVIKLDNNYNFAIARVRLQGSSGVSGEAENVRVFFRLFTTLSNDTDFDSSGAYLSNPDAAGQPGSPLVGASNTTIPMFATNNLPSNTDYDPGGPNIQTIVIPNNQDGVYHYYGCFLNVYDQNNTINSQPVQALLNGDHHCLVAQIAYDDAPIPQGASPLSWDQLAQRNLQVTFSDNPGPAASHRIPQTFDCRPSGVVVAPGSKHPPVLPDELMIDWGAIPPGSVASLYWPQVNAADVIKLASQFYSSNPLKLADSHTIQLNITAGLSYIPIPSGAGESFAGLFTVDLPPGKVFNGQNFDILVRRLSSKTYTPPPPIQTPTTTHTLPARFEEAAKDSKAKAASVGKANSIQAQARNDSTVSYSGAYSWRYMVGAFKVQIPVTTAENILPTEENTLAIMKWRLQEMLPSNRWYPVLQKYISYISDRIAGLGGNPNAIPPSLSGAPIAVIGKTEASAYTGKICEVIYDCFGNFAGFVLESCCERHSFSSHEPGIGEIVLRACRERMIATVYVGPAPHNKIREIVIGSYAGGSSRC